MYTIATTIAILIIMCVYIYIHTSGDPSIPSTTTPPTPQNGGTEIPRGQIVFWPAGPRNAFFNMIYIYI